MAFVAIGLLKNPVASVGADRIENTNEMDAKIVQLNKKGTTLEKVIQVLGEPEKYTWMQKTVTKTNLPSTFIAEYPGGVEVVMIGGVVNELRCQGKGPGFGWHGTLRLGSSVEEVFKALGSPEETVEGKSVPSMAIGGVFYKNINGVRGRGYYARTEKGVRVFLDNDRVSALYLMVDQEDGHRAAMSNKKVKGIEPYTDVRFRHLGNLDLSNDRALLATLTFGPKTVWPKSLPPGFDPSKLLEAAKNPGLGVRQLHKDGLTGKGVNVAIIDQPMSQNHPEFAGKIIAYEDVGCDSDSSMHGPAVASLLVGNECGTAPDAKLYFAAAPSWTGDSAYFAKALDWIVAQNAKLPSGQKIRVVSVSAAPSGPGSPFTKNNSMWDAARDRAEKAGLLILDCSQNHGFIGPCYYDSADPESVAKCTPGFPNDPWHGGTERVLVPNSPRTTAQEIVQGDLSFQYCGQGGLSWSIPYCAGVLAMGWQARPDLDGAQMRQLLFQSAYKTTDGALIINPPEFIRMVKAFKTVK